MSLCERALQPLWGARMADSFSVYQTAARCGARAKTIVALQPLTPPLFEAALTDLHSKTAGKHADDARVHHASKSNRIGVWHAADSDAAAAAATTATAAGSGAALVQELLHALQSNPKLLQDPQVAASETAAAATAAAAAAATASTSARNTKKPTGVAAIKAAPLPPPAHHPTDPKSSQAPPTPSVLRSSVEALPSALVPLLDLSRIDACPAHSPALAHNTLPSLTATPLTARSEWLRRGGGTSPMKKPVVVDGAESTEVVRGRELALLLASDAMADAQQLLHEKQLRLQQPLTDTVSMQYRSLKCPSPDLGFRIVFNGSSSYNIHRPFDTVRIVSARSSRTILDRAVAPLSERQQLPRRRNHGQFVTFREDFFDDDGSRAATRSSARSGTRTAAGAPKPASSHKLEAKLDALESIALKALYAQPTLVPRCPVASTRAAATHSPFSDAAPSHSSPAAHPSPPLPKNAAAAIASPRVRRVGVTQADGSMVLLQHVFAGVGGERGAASQKGGK
jgi:hypothetical protein